MAVALEANTWAIRVPLRESVKDNFPEVESFTRIKPPKFSFEFRQRRSKNKERVSMRILLSLGDVLDIHLIKGDPRHGIGRHYSMVLISEKARSYFGDEDPMGKNAYVVE